MPLSDAERMRSYRERRKADGQPDTSRTNRKEHKRVNRTRTVRIPKPFVGCDGEGGGTDEHGRQLYKLFRIGDRELFSGGALSSAELLDFVCDSPVGAILVGFAFGYDVTMILRDVPEKQQRRLFEPKVFGEGRSPYIWYQDFGIDYLPKQYLRVCRLENYVNDQGQRTKRPVKGSSRTIYETFGFFQKSFLKAIEDFDVGTPEQRKRIKANKDKRSDFNEMTQEVRDYCELECDFLAQMMEKLRGYCHAAGIYPHTWNGAGKLASALLALHETPRAKQLAPLIPDGLSEFANMAYYGGRFEITRTGLIKETVHEYDIRSAYPDGMRHLPCLVHGTWVKKNAQSLRHDRGLYVASCTFKASCEREEDRFGKLGALPIRSREGHLFWPLQGAGVYWSPEIESAKTFGFKIALKEGWSYEKRCDCEPFDWMEPLFNYRRSVGSQGVGYPLKLGYNSCYGKLAQRKGNGSFNNMIWAGLITALTRAKLNQAVASAPSPQDIVMLATDAIYSLSPLNTLNVGENLGDWEHTELPGMFIVQPGLYWSPELRKKKSRGLSGKFFETRHLTEKFEHAWQRYMAEENSKLETPFPVVMVPVPSFVGLRLALARNKPQTAGCWVNDKREISFDYRNKRQGHIWRNGHLLTGIKYGGRNTLSLPHRDFLAAGGQEPWEQARLMLEEQPDYIDLGPPFKDD